MFKLLFEKKIEQHHLLRRIYPESVNTIRIDTLRCVSGKLVMSGALLRVGKGGRKVDNWSGPQGGIAIAIDLEKGCLNRGGYDYFLNEYPSHPDSGFSFDNTIIPFWKELLGVVRQTANLFPQANSIGWDIAITEKGPIIIEANTDYGITSLQTTNGPYLKKRDFINALNEHIGISKYKKRYEKYFVV